jgi:hypothetical protein
VQRRVLRLTEKDVSRKFEIGSGEYSVQRIVFSLFERKDCEDNTNNRIGVDY